MHAGGEGIRVWGAVFLLTWPCLLPLAAAEAGSSPDRSLPGFTVSERNGHRFLEPGRRRQEFAYADGTRVTIDLDADTWEVAPKLAGDAGGSAASNAR